MASTKLAVIGLIAMLFAVEAAPRMNGPMGNFNGPQSQSRGRFGSRGGNFGGCGGQNNQAVFSSLPRGNNGGSSNSCEKFTCFTPQTSNDTINQINNTWASYVSGQPCDTYMKQQDSILKTAIDTYITNAANANLTNSAALAIFNQFKSAFAALDAAVDAFMNQTADVQNQLIQFEENLLRGGTPGPMPCFMNRGWNNGNMNMGNGNMNMGNGGNFNMYG